MFYQVFSNLNSSVIHCWYPHTGDTGTAINKVDLECPGMFCSSTAFRIPKAWLLDCMCVRSQGEMVLTSWRSLGEVPADVCPHTGKSWWWGWFLFLKKGRGSCKVLYDSSIKPQDKTHRRIWCKKVGVLVESLEERCLNTLLVPGLDFKSFKEQMGMCVLTNEPSLWQFSWPPGQHLHLSTPPLLLPYS